MWRLAILTCASWFGGGCSCVLGEGRRQLNCWILFHKQRVAHLHHSSSSSWRKKKKWCYLSTPSLMKAPQINIEIILEWIMNNAELFARGNLINQTIRINSLHVEVRKNRENSLWWCSSSFLPFFLSVFLSYFLPLWFHFKDAESLCGIFQLRLCKYAAQSQKCCYSRNAVTYIVTFTILPSLWSAANQGCPS